MGELSVPILVYVIIFLSLPFVFGYVARHFRLPLILGYIVSGVAISLFFKAESQSMLSLYANIGLFLLLFTVGLEMRFDNFRRFSRFIVVGGLLQIGLTALLLFLVNVMFGMLGIQAMLVGVALAFSSTAVASKLILERDEENTLPAQLSTGVLLFQDLLVIPLMVILISLQSTQSEGAFIGSIIFSVVKSIAILLLIYVIGEKIVPKVFARVGRISGELLNLFSVLFIFLTVFLFMSLGLPGTLAAFVAGLLAGQTSERVQVFSQIRPLRDVFVILFFVFLGATLDVSTHFTLLPLILGLGLIVVFIKLLVVVVLFMYLKFHSKISFAIGIFISQVGEFAFIMLYQTKVLRFIDERTYFLSVGVTLFSIVMTPILLTNRDNLYLKIRKFIKLYLPMLDNLIAYGVDRDLSIVENKKFGRHVVICGYGSMGKYVARALKLSEIDYVVVDYNYYLVKNARAKDVPMIYGDPTQIDILEHAQTGDAACIVVAIPDMNALESIILNARILNKEIIIFTRVDIEQNQQRIKDLGAQVVVQPEFEAAISVIKKILSANGINREDIAGKIKRLKIEHGMA